MLDVTALQTFVTVVNAGSFVAAARILRVTPAMVGRRIQALEARYATRLIERTTRAQRLTQAGEQLFGRSESILAELRELDDVMAAAPGLLDGRIRITAPTTLGAVWLAAIVARFQFDYPKVMVQMVLTDRRVELVSEGFDLAVRVGEHRGDSTMMARRIGTYSTVLVATPEHIAHHGGPSHPNDLTACRCIINLNIWPRRWVFEKDGERVEANVHGGLQIDSSEAQRAAVLQHAGVAYLPEELVRSDIDAGRLVRLLPDWAPMRFPLWLVYPSRQVARRVAVLVAAIEAGLPTP